MKAARQLQDLLGLSRAAVAVTFRDAPPPGVARASAPGPSSCSYWKRAAEGQTFWTDAADHCNCPIGAHVHGVSPPPSVQQELQGVVETMIGLGYLRSEEVAAIPRREAPFQVAVYAPCTAAEESPDVVIVGGNARQVMLLVEAAASAGCGGEGTMGRPTCAAQPEAMRTGRAVASLGCIGNRVYTGLADDEMYFVLPGRHLNAVVEKLAVIVQANRELEKYHRKKLSAVSSQLAARNPQESSSG
jgi:uncharacterized protein (DUF169 family)